MELEKTLREAKERAEQEFKKLEQRLLVIDKERNEIRVEQTRYQGEYRLIMRLLDDCQSERAGLPPLNPPLETPQAGENIEVENE